MKNERTRKLRELGQSIWIDNITRKMLGDDTLQAYIDTLSVTGLTSNPTIFEQAMAKGSDYDAQIAEESAAGRRGEDLFFELALRDLRRAADSFAQVHKDTRGIDGFVSLEVSPLLVDDAAATLQWAKKLHAAAARPNLYIKIPGTAAGVQAIEESIFAGVPVNVTLLFSRDHYLAVAEAYMRAIERRIAAGLSPVVESVASLFVSRWDAKVKDKVGPELQNKLGIAVAMRCYKAYRDLLSSARWKTLAAAGAHPQRLLLASTGTKDPKASDVLYVQALAAPDTVNTMPDKTLQAFADHGEIAGPMPVDGGDAERVIAQFREAGIDDAAVAAELQQEAADSFAKSWQSLLAGIDKKVAALAPAT